MEKQAIDDRGDQLPVAVCIGRQFGCGGREIGRRVAELLNLEYYDTALLDEAARASGVTASIFEAADERAPRVAPGLWPINMGLNAGAYMVGDSTLGDQTVYSAQCDAIKAIAARGGCVIVGRTADYVLRQPDAPACRVVSVFLHAPIEARVARMLRRGDAPDEKAARRVAAEQDEARADYYNFYTNGGWGQAANYDLCLNAALVDDDTAAALIANFVHSTAL